MALPGVYITDSDGNIGTVTESVEDVCGMIFDYGGQQNFTFAHKDEVLELTSAADLETYGIKKSGETGAVLGGIPYYHIKQFFGLRGGSGRLFVLFADCTSDWTALSKLQRYAHGLIYQTAVWTEQSLWKLNDASASVYALGLLADIQSECYSIANDMNAPMSVLLYPNVNKVQVASGVQGGSEVPVFNKIPTVKGDYRYVSVMLGQSNDEDVLAMQDALTSKTPVGAAGVDLAMLANNSVPTCIGYVGGCDYSGYIPGIVFGFGTDMTKYESVSIANLTDLHNKGYNFFMKYEGDEVGVYRNFDHTCTDGDYRTIARNRVMGKTRRQVRAALLPMVNRTVLIDPATGYMTSAAQAIFINAVNTVLDAMVAAGEISGHSTPVINQTASILQTDAVYISYSVIPVGIASEIYVTQSLSITA